MYDIIIIGSGPAGLTAAIYARRAGKSVLILEKGAFGGQMTSSPKIENYPGYTAISGTELADKMIEQALALGAEVELEEALEIKTENGIKTVITDCSERECRALIIAAGVKHRTLGLEGEGDFIGDGISFCAVCDGAFYAGQDVAVIGGGNSALQEAILLSETSKKVTVVQNLDRMTGEAALVETLASKPNVEMILSHTAESIISDGGVFKGLNIKDANGSIRPLYCGGVFVAIGLVPANKPFESVARLNAWGYFDSDETCLTETEGVFVAGDCRSKTIRQITTATADGASAALAACRYLD